MNGWLIYQQEDALNNSSYIDWMIREAKKQQITLTLVLRHELDIGSNRRHPVFSIKERPVTLPDMAIIRTIEPTLQLAFEALSIPVFNNSYTAAICNNKIRTYIEMEKIGVPIMQTLFLYPNAFPALAPLTFPFVLKSATGRGGGEVFLIQDQPSWKQYAAKLKQTEAVAQSTENIQFGRDVRVFVIGKSIVSAVLRENDTDFRANFKLGGNAVPFPLSEDKRLLVQRIINHFDFGLVGIDFLLTKDGAFVFNEIEDVVGSRILSETSDINLLEKYISFIKEEVNHLSR